MPLPNRDIILGKLAIGREYVTRKDANEIAAEVEASAVQGRNEDFAGAAVRLGYLPPRQVNELETVIKMGTLICRGTCGQKLPLAALSAAETVSCAICGDRSSSCWTIPKPTREACWTNCRRGILVCTSSTSRPTPLS